MLARRADAHRVDIFKRPHMHIFGKHTPEMCLAQMAVLRQLFYPYWFHVVIGDIVHGAGDDAGDPALLGIRARLFVRVV